MSIPKKSLGQHWLTDDRTLSTIVQTAGVQKSDTVLEIGPGQGSLTSKLTAKAGQVIAIELDESLAASLPKTLNAGNLEVIQGDVLKFDLSTLPRHYKVVANIPYYLTSNLLRILAESANPPAFMVLLVQKEVAERLCAVPGQMSILAVSVQLYYECRLGQLIPAELFTPPPKVDSQVVILNQRPKPLFENLDSKLFFRLVKAGFSEKRKKLRSSLAGGLGISRQEVDGLLKKAAINGDRRAQELSLREWHRLLRSYQKMTVVSAPYPTNT